MVRQGADMRTTWAHVKLSTLLSGGLAAAGFVWKGMTFGRNSGDAHARAIVHCSAKVPRNALTRQTDPIRHIVHSGAT